MICIYIYIFIGLFICLFVYFFICIDVGLCIKSIFTYFYEYIDFNEVQLCCTYICAALVPTCYRALTPEVTHKNPSEKPMGISAILQPQNPGYFMLFHVFPCMSCSSLDATVITFSTYHLILIVCSGLFRFTWGQCY